MLHFVNMDLLAAGLSPLKPELAALKAGKLFLQELDRLAGARQLHLIEPVLENVLIIVGVSAHRHSLRWGSCQHRRGRKAGDRKDRHQGEGRKFGHFMRSRCSGGTGRIVAPIGDHSQ